ncbi:hypothetical protein [Devosia sp. SD17-2]|uniref:hypothetical protein n=1 Tax=Devosia sp. SD17-2 TaxID=2976459 RepID=UPI0023D838AD|nr:hypothetical protein [Devosia sp. SD17-2]WEJ31627.1 hypothetical protein NYQ88_11975 [Devosia sp. SD17-2]
MYKNTTSITGRDVVGVVGSVELIVDDQIEGKCWTNTSAISAKIRVELEKFGISVYTEKLATNTVFSPVLHIGGLGYRMGNGVCTGQARFELYYFGNTRMGSLEYTGGHFEFRSPVEIWEASAIFTNSDRLDQQILDKVQEWTDSLIADISKARRTEGVKAVLAAWPEYNPLTQAEFDAFMKEPDD